MHNKAVLLFLSLLLFSLLSLLLLLMLLFSFDVIVFDIKKFVLSIIHSKIAKSLIFDITASRMLQKLEKKLQNNNR